MKKIVLSALFVALINFCFAFEGIVSMKYNYLNGSQIDLTINWYISGNQVKMGMLFNDGKNNFETFIVPNLSQANMLVYSTKPAENGQKYYTIVPVENISSNLKNTDCTIEDKGNAAVEGKDCAVYAAKFASVNTQFYLDRNIDINFGDFAQFFKSDYVMAAIAHGKLSGFPVKLNTLDINGNILDQAMLISIVEQKLDAKVFGVPVGYQNMAEVK